MTAPQHRLHLLLDPELGPALWVREQTAPGRSRAAEELTAVLESCPPAVRTALAQQGPRLRHRVRVAGSAGRPDRRVPALALGDEPLIALVQAVRSVLEHRFGDEFGQVLAQLLADGRAALLSEQAAAMPDLLAAVALEERARHLVDARQLRIDSRDSAGGTTLHWAPTERDGPPMLTALTDAHARRAFAAHREAVRAAAGTAAHHTNDPLGVLDALTTQAPLGGDLPAQRRLMRALETWLRTARTGVRLTSTDAQLVVRLHEPPLGTAWPLQTCLREADGTVHPVADLRAVGDVSAAGAAEASAAVLQLAPTVREAAVDDTGVDWLLTTTQAGQFLSLDTPALEDAGVTVLLPRDWTKQPTRLRAEPREETTDGERRPGVGLGAMASFRWRMAVGDLELSDEEMQEIRDAQSELVRLRGQWVRLDATTLRAAERFLESFAARAHAGQHDVTSPRADKAAPASRPRIDDEQPAAVPPVPPLPTAGQMPWTDLFSLLLSGDGADVNLAADAAEAVADQRGGLLDLLPGGPGAPQLPPPHTLHATLRPYQQAGLEWMWALHEMGTGGILADDMGLGKTMQVLALLCREREVGGELGPTLLVCPMSVVGAWQREARTFAPHLSVHVHHGGDRIRDESFAPGALDTDLVITTYSLLARDQGVLGSVDWHRVVLDEAQHVKNPGTQVARAARSLQARHRLALTGTPVENRLDDLHALMETVNPGLLGELAGFRERIAQPIERDADPSALSRLKFVTGPFILRRLKTDRTIIADLPEKIELTRVVNLTAEQAGLYQALVDELLVQIDGAEQAQRRSLVVSTLTRLKQVCNHPAHYLQDGSELLRDGEHRSGKLALADDLLTGAFANGAKVLAFTQFTAFGHLLVPYWRERFGVDVPFLHGGVAKADRDAMVARFQAEPDTPEVMLLSLRAGGTGLTLTAASHVLHLDRWWNPAVENQATDRAYRIGQQRAVTVHTLVSAGTVEERIDQVLTDKSALADLAIGPGEGWMADLDDAALHRLLSLDEEV